MRFPASQGDPIMASGRTEAFELLKAYLGTTLAFGILLNRLSSFSISQAAVIAALTAGAGFVVHELAHRVVARAFGAQARFWANNLMLLLAIIGAFFVAIVLSYGAMAVSALLLWLIRLQRVTL
ncbi:MAG: hypothetical protein H0X37_24055 [Herpetosiphonaceae bacterium]|nr:hypothetical protein [Herpetosiphonaceae bacterium]